MPVRVDWTVDCTVAYSHARRPGVNLNPTRETHAQALQWNRLSPGSTPGQGELPNCQLKLGFRGRFLGLGFNINLVRISDPCMGQLSLL